jgi:hypothetical protein
MRIEENGPDKQTADRYNSSVPMFKRALPAENYNFVNPKPNITKSLTSRGPTNKIVAIDLKKVEQVYSAKSIHDNVTHVQCRLNRL